MTPEEKNQLAELIEKRLDESITDSEAADVEAKLKASKEARRLFLDLTSQHANLQMLGDSLTIEKLTHHEKPYSIRALAAAAAVVIGCFFWLQNSQPETVATLVSNEDAAWESTLPTAPGSKLEAGQLELKAGVATIRFHSGAEVILEAPAKLELQTPMRGKLFFGAAVIDVPEPAIGFIMDTPGGYVVDHGTQFAVKVSPDTTDSSFTVISGEISVHHPPTGKELHMTEDQVSTITDQGLQLKSDQTATKAHRTRKSKRIRAGSLATSIVRNDMEHLLHPDLLMAKSQEKKIAFDRRSLFSFNVTKEELKKARYARLRFYVVPSGFGYAAHLPQTNTFAVYGVTDESTENFPIDCKWDQAPPIETARKLGTFSLKRSKLKGVQWFRSDALLEFVKADTTGRVTFILVRETHEIDRHGLVHAFAKDSHPEGSGPVLDLGFEEFVPGKRALVSQTD
ncbi:MAG: iron dicitrate transport regulator FecR [Limisphaerales bacterium]